MGKSKSDAAAAETPVTVGFRNAEKLLRKQLEGGFPEYLVLWNDGKEPSWVPEHAVVDYQLIEDFDQNDRTTRYRRRNGEEQSAVSLHSVLLPIKKVKKRKKKSTLLPQPLPVVSESETPLQSAVVADIEESVDAPVAALDEKKEKNREASIIILDDEPEVSPDDLFILDDKSSVGEDSEENSSSLNQPRIIVENGFARVSVMPADDSDVPEVPVSILLENVLRINAGPDAESFIASMADFELSLKLGVPAELPDGRENYYRFTAPEEIIGYGENSDGDSFVDMKWKDGFSMSVTFPAAVKYFPLQFIPWLENHVKEQASQAGCSVDDLLVAAENPAVLKNMLSVGGKKLKKSKKRTEKGRKGRG